MRRTFFTALADAADIDDRIFLLVADIGFMAIDPFTDRHPKKWLNCGVAEQNMIGVATGLAKNGYITFCYSITPFAVLRPLEQILRGPILHGLNVVIVGAGRGDEYGHANGKTHWAHEAEDVMDMVIPTVYRPSSKTEIAWTVTDVLSNNGPAFISLSKGGCS